MASSVKNWTVNNGQYVVNYADGHTQVMTQNEAISAGIITDPGAITSAGKKIPSIVKPGQYGANTGTAIADPFGSGVTAGSNFAVPVKGQPVPVPIGTLLQKANDPKVLAQIGSALREYGIISKGTKSQQSIINAYTSVLVKAAAVTMDPNDWMAQFKAAGGGQDTANAGPQTNISIRTYTPETIRTIADQLYINKLGKRVSDTDLQKLSDQLNALEKKTPTKSVSVPNAAGTSTTTTTSGGVDEQAFISKQAEQMPEYGRMQNINFASWLDKAMTTGQPSIGSLTNG